MKTQRTRVLIVGDDILISEMTRQILEQMGYVVVGMAANGRQAIDRTEKLSGSSDQPDVILMDIGLPDIDAIEAIRQMQELCPTPVVVLTGFDTPELVKRASTTGVGAYLVKPPDRNALERAITIAIARFDDTMELHRLNAELQAQIGERIQAEERLKASLQERELLLREVHHRIKNNLQIISSLLDLQSSTVQSEHAREAFRASQTRVRSIARIHEHLCQAPDLEQVDMARYTEDLVNRLCEFHGASDVVPKIDVADVIVVIDTAIPLGLIISELVSNSLKHAFAPDKDESPERICEISVSLRRLDALESEAADEGQIELVVSDNGSGLPADIDLESLTSLGLTLVRVLTEQLEGQLELLSPAEGRRGATIRIAVPASAAS